ncbi:mitochondrial inner membrane protease subunit 2-like [Orbicella faveolata]|uniref:mitochondrial inner membrane protease subunit 2-like n=1 Tax=Orbicella faveolata TaxID=48498 RepID=UPI0009E57D83|nr:mitochondrial inner membrane protease subunit 2-like [Orbicella faveolata]
MVYQRFRPYLNVLGMFTRGFVIGLPIVVTFVENVGSVKGVLGISMQPTLNPNPHLSSDKVVVNCWAVRQFEGINRGDIVTLIDPTDPGGVLIKRVIALEGDHVKSLNYKKKIVKIPQGHCWVEGDNHSHSHDSNSFGPVTIGLIKGKATHIVWPPKRWQRLENFTPEGRLAFGDNFPLSETENVTDTLSDSETETQTENSSSCRSYIDRDSTSVPEFMYGPTS